MLTRDTSRTPSEVIPPNRPVAAEPSIDERASRAHLRWVAAPSWPSARDTT
jgi:hypothetical protein